MNNGNSNLHKSGAKTSAAKLDKTVFALDVKNHDLLKQAYPAYQANGRENLAVTKTRGLVSGGGRKPWKQRVQVGLALALAVTQFGAAVVLSLVQPAKKNYSQSINTKAKRLACAKPSAWPLLTIASSS